jgi:type I restriction enzyme R subunit
MGQTNLHQEHHFEAEICQHLSATGWLYAEGDAASFDRANGLFLPDLNRPGFCRGSIV